MSNTSEPWYHGVCFDIFVECICCTMETEKKNDPSENDVHVSQVDRVDRIKSSKKLRQCRSPRTQRKTTQHKSTQTPTDTMATGPVGDKWVVVEELVVEPGQSIIKHKVKF